MSSTPEPSELYAAREPIFPRRVQGRFRNLKWGLMAVMLGIYYITPWIRWDRGPDMPDQAVLVDLAGRRFFFFFVEIWPHEFYFVAGLLIMAGLGLFLFTSALGRVWCGYACPQTVWTDLFMTVERWLEGDRNARVRLWKAPWGLHKARVYLTKWTIWLFIALATGGAWVFYFADAPTLLRNLLTFDAHPAAWITIAILTATTFFFGGFFREQICIYACPWPRIQAAMMDEDTLTIAYRDWRGEPRGKLRKGEIAPGQGDCIDCMACVNVCPMGIDIRNGQQMECITCGLCIDACDEVMDRIGKPRGLIAYIALSDEEHEKEGKPAISVWRHVFRPRTVLYSVLWGGVGIGLIALLLLRTDLDMSVAQVRNPLNVAMSDGSVRNAYEVRIRNMHGEARDFTLTLDAPVPMTLVLEGVVGDTVTVAADEMLNQRVYLIAPPDSPAASAQRTDVTLRATEGTSGQVTATDTLFNGRGN